MKFLFRAALLLALVAVGVALMLPTDVVTSLRTEHAWLGTAFRKVGKLWPGVDMHHALAFAVLGGIARLGYPRVRPGKVVLALAVLAVVSEIAQFFVPGREPAMSDVVADVVGGMVGYGVAWVLGWASGRRGERVW